MKAGLGFEATSAPNTTSGLTDGDMHQDRARERGDNYVAESGRFMEFAAHPQREIIAL